MGGIAFARVGDVWEFTAPEGIGTGSGARASITLTRRDGDHEVWTYDWCYKDGSGYERDWAPTFRKASELVRVHFMGKCEVRFRQAATPDVVPADDEPVPEV